ncbi:hypothetical protein JMY81_04475 [Brenneria goodwinii]|nr:hypothetical protein [Brenneria goodwinii]MCG8160091.1 hypothetical protein [Brenneria goodwinii]MCG8164614.1 hypothetical protein [Brenneria goodwinii]MCG8170680.1 hypothetical protein [Brenneria goodwinii]MCG8174208.1 hypothetical protein [Brenneria goodwinii]
MVSMDVFLAAVAQGDEGFIPLAVVESAFHHAITLREVADNKCTLLLEYPNPDAGKQIAWPDGSTATVSDVDTLDITIKLVSNGKEPMTNGFGVNRSPHHAPFWQSLYQILETTHTAFFWPGNGDNLIVGQKETIPHLPESMINALGAPYVVSNYQQITERMRG